MNKARDLKKNLMSIMRADDQDPSKHFLQYEARVTVCVSYRLVLPCYEFEYFMALHICNDMVLDDILFD